MRLTNDTVRTLPAGSGGDTLYPDNGRHGVPGFYLRVREGGARTFIIQWRQGGAQRRSTIGKVGVLSLDEARTKARKLLVGIGDGQDPAAVKAKARIDDKQLFGKLVEEYLSARSADVKASSLDQMQRHLRQYFKPLHQLPLNRINRATVASELRSLASGRGKVAADRSRSTLSAFFGWAVCGGIVEANPVIGTGKVSNAKSRERVLTDAEIVAVWNAASGEFGRIVKLLMLTGQRRNEIAGLRCAEIDGDMIRLPGGTRTKNSRPHDVPLSAQALSVLGEQPQRASREIIFGSGAGGFSHFGDPKRKLDAASGVAGWTLHDLRRTCATGMADLGVQPHIIEAVLNHVSGHKGGVAGIYNRSSYEKEKRAALTLWGTHIATLLAQASGANVAVLKRA